jgi:hypothetical protein
MIRSLSIAIAMGCVAVICAWFIIPASTYIEDALGIIMVTFLLTVILTFSIQRAYLAKRN